MDLVEEPEEKRCFSLLDCIVIDKKNCLNGACFRFLMLALLSFISIIVAICGLSGSFNDEIPTTFFTNLFTFIIGIWVPTPFIKKK